MELIVHWERNAGRSLINLLALVFPFGCRMLLIKMMSNQFQENLDDLDVEYRMSHTKERKYASFCCYFFVGATLSTRLSPEKKTRKLMILLCP